MKKRDKNDQTGTQASSSPALVTCETSQVLLAGVSGFFSRGSPVFAPPIDWSVSYELKLKITLKGTLNLIKNVYVSHIPEFTSVNV